jgi:hypothetical protein
MRSFVRPFAFAAALAAAPVLGAQTTPTPTSPAGPGGAPAATPGMQDSSRRGAAQDTMRHGGMGHGAATQGTPRAGAARGSAANQELVARLDSVDTAAKAGLTDVPVATAVSLIQSIETRLQASTRPALRSVARDLSALRGELGAPTVDGRRVGVILRRLGPKVTTVARTQSGAVRATLQSIGTQLTTAGGQLVAAAAAPAGR